MKLKPKLHVIALALLTAGAQPAVSQDAPPEALQTWAVFEKGQDLFVRLRYSGGLEGWDAAFAFDGTQLTTVNSAFITVTDSEGKKLPPRPDKLLHKSMNAWKKEPFDTRVNLAEVYDLSAPGRYVVEWGCEKIGSQVARIEIAK